MKQFLLLAMLAGGAGAAIAQSSHSDRLPWVEGKLPPVKGKYEYRISQGEGSTLRQARDDAFSGILVDLGSQAGIAVDSRSLVKLKSELGYSAGASRYSESDSQTTTFSIKRKGVNIALAEAGEYYENRYGRYQLWKLYEVSTSGSFKAFIPEYTTTYGFDGAWKSAVLPGWGQFYKGKTGKGIFFLAAEAAAVSGLIFCEMKRSDNVRKSQESTNLAIIKEYRSRADSWALYRNVAVGAAAGVYLWNVLDAALAKGKIRYAWIPNNLHLATFAYSDVCYYGIEINF
ncbi:MAG: hypothetical protein LBL94_07200 [Prevotellaceae bacterium]|jgi:hypothetical protein|nr:hypothetical protein [Prevotellaceae bacterium]